MYNVGCFVHLISNFLSANRSLAILSTKCHLDDQMGGVSGPLDLTHILTQALMFPDLEYATREILLLLYAFPYPFLVCYNRQEF